MITVFVQNSFIKEKRYILEFLLGEVLKIEFEIKTDNVATYRFVLGNSRLVINDAFFSKLDDAYPYYKDFKLIPDEIDYMTCEDFDYAFPVLFGDDTVNNDDGFISCGNDIIAASFFMLTRWEEISTIDRDKHDRYREEKSLAIRFGFHQRPIVNEYINLLAKMLNDSGFDIVIPKRKFNLFLTHDVDDIARYDKLSKIIKALGGDIINRKSLRTFFRTIKDVSKIRLRKMPDVYNRFNFIMDLSEKRHAKSAFYFIPGLDGEEDVRFDINDNMVHEIIASINARSHIIGIHPSYSSYCNHDRLMTEKKRMFKYNPSISEGRQHYLRYKIPRTWREWDECGLKVDSGMGYYNTVGFRCGICYEFPVFDVEKRCQLELRERPLIVMDTALRKHAVTKKKCIAECLKMAQITRKFNGDFVLLWHNSNLSVNEWEGWDSVYKQITESI